MRRGGHKRLYPLTVQAQTVEEILSGNGLEDEALYADSREGVTVQVEDSTIWTPQVGGVTLASPQFGQGPAYAADGDNFNGLPVIQAVGLNGQYMFAEGASPPFWAAGPDAYLAVVARIADFVNGSRIFQSWQTFFAGLGPSITVTPDGDAVFNGASVHVADPEAVCFYEAFLSGGNAVIAVNGVQDVGDPFSLDLDVDIAYLGVSEDPSSDPTNYAAVICLPAASSAVRAALLASAQATWM